MRGRPLAFLVLVVTGWGAGRVMSLLPEIRPLELASEEIVPPAKADVLPQTVATALQPPAISAERAMFRPTGVAARDIGRSAAQTSFAAIVAVAPRASSRVEGVVPMPGMAPMLAPPGLPSALPTTHDRSRWSGSAWAIARDGGGGSLLSPLLGGSQAGLRIAYRLDERGRFAAFARVAAPLKHGPAELAAGAQWQPTAAAPVTVYAEVRAIRGDAAPAAGVFGGGAVALPARFRLEGYGQAGVIGRGGVSGFGDGQIRVVRPIERIELGAGLWAAAQRGASRLDVGPSLALPIPADPLALRITLDWRHRIAGNARPASGPVVSLGADF